MPRVKLFDENEVLTKAMHLFWKQGYGATSINDLVAHLGINRASLYATFGDKDRLFKKSFALYRQTNIEAITQFFKKRTNVKEGFLALFEMAINEAVEETEYKGCFVVNTTTELIPNDDSFLNILEDNKQDFIQLFYNYLLQGKQGGQIKTNEDLKSIATMLYSLFNGIKVVSKIRPNRQELLDSIRISLSVLD